MSSKQRGRTEINEKKSTGIEYMKLQLRQGMDIINTEKE